MFARRNNRGFSLVELLAVVLILAVLSAVAVPLYINTRKTSAARTCLSNITAIAAAESAWATRNGGYVADGSGGPAAETQFVPGTPPTGGLIGAPEALSSPTKCPLDGASYKITIAADGACTITCPHDATGAAADKHSDVMNTGSWTKTLAAPVKDQAP